MALHNFFADRQADAQPAPFGGKLGFKDMLQRLARVWIAPIGGSQLRKQPLKISSLILAWINKEIA
ncbi:MAG: hypothetical protein Q8O74_10290, partial [bacterium]|nr:hypothetical protein [bacterium]